MSWLKSVFFPYNISKYSIEVDLELCSCCSVFVVFISKWYVMDDIRNMYFTVLLIFKLKTINGRHKHMLLQNTPWKGAQLSTKQTNQVIEIEMPFHYNIIKSSGAYLTFLCSMFHVCFIFIHALLSTSKLWSMLLSTVVLLILLGATEAIGNCGIMWISINGWDWESCEKWQQPHKSGKVDAIKIINIGTRYYVNAEGRFKFIKT